MNNSLKDISAELNLLLTSKMSRPLNNRVNTFRGLRSNLRKHLRTRLLSNNLDGIEVMRMTAMIDMDAYNEMHTPILSTFKIYK